MILSIVVPMFNTEVFVDKCLKSMLQQPVPFELYEVIVVNDGSTDGSLLIAENIRKINSNIKILNQANSGLGAARNAGLAEAKGDYVWFVDSDDYLTENALPKIFNSILKMDPDVLVVNMKCADEVGNSIDWINCKFEAGDCDLMRGGEFFDKNYYWTYSALYIFKKSLLRENFIEYHPSINMQDAEMLPRALVHAERVFISNLKVYVYVKRANSFVNSTKSDVRDKYFYSVVEVHARLKKFADSDIVDNSMLSGLSKKINVIEEILLLSFVYDKINFKSRKMRIVASKEAGVYPFRFNATGNINTRIKRSLLRFAVNASPIFFPDIFANLRKIIRKMSILLTSQKRGTHEH